jgi:nucleoside phosphorylase
MKSGIKADFIVITALDEETKALKRRLENVTSLKGTSYSCGTISHYKGEKKYIVIYAQCDETGNYAAGSLTMDAITKFHPAYVILVGIAAGFPEQGVALGDVLVPEWVVAYSQTDCC